MAEEQHELRQINWSELFGFTQIFKGFKMAIHPTKLILGLGAIVAIFLLGWILSLIWSLIGWNVQIKPTVSATTLGPPYQTEIAQYYQAPSNYAFDRTLRQWQQAQLSNAALLLANVQENRRSHDTFNTRYLTSARGISPLFKNAFTQVAKTEQGVEAKTQEQILQEARKDDQDYDDLLEDAEEHLEEDVEALRGYVDQALEQAEKDVNDNPELSKDEDARQRAEEQIQRDHKLAMSLVARYEADVVERMAAVGGRPIFPALLDYELSCVKNAVNAALLGNFLTGLCNYQQNVEDKAMPVVAGQVDMNQQYDPGGDQQPGFFAWVLRGAWGFCWLIREHWVFAAIFLVGSLAILAVFGGAMARIAALEFCRQERISIGQALSFSCSKALSFFSAPLIPIFLSVAAGVMIALSGLVGSIPFVGDVLLVLLLGITILIGMGIAFLLIGLIAGAGLMYPTIAVEGSDSFDSMGRTFSYIFGRPWHAIFYGLVALIYGAITYVFVRFFLYLGLLATHTTLSWGVVRNSSLYNSDKVHPYADKLDLFWTPPTFSQLFRGLNWQAFNVWEAIIAVCIGIVIFLVASVAYAYLLSYYFSASTIIYCLLRRKVDATDLDEAYTEEFEQQMDWTAPAMEEEPAPAGPEETGQDRDENIPGPAEGEPPAAGEIQSGDDDEQTGRDDQADDADSDEKDSST
jgi:hypothetical protein